MSDFLHVFIPLFVSIDAFGLVICLAFMFLGDATFRFLGITADDFRIAGGILLLVLAVMDLLMVGKPSVHENEMVGVVPLAMPMIAGPATLTTVLVLVKAEGLGYAMTALSLSLNFSILLLALLASVKIAKVVGVNTLRAFSKLVMVLLAAIAVNFIRVGVTNVVRGG